MITLFQFENRDFNRQAGAISMVFLFVFKEYDFYKRSYHINIILDPDLEENSFKVLGRSLQSLNVNFVYNLNEFFTKSKQERRLELLNMLINGLKQIFISNHQDLDEIKSRIIDKNFHFEIPIIKKASSKKLSLLAQIIVKPDIDKNDAYFIITDQLTGVEVFRQLLVELTAGIFFGYKRVFDKLKWEKNRVFLVDEYNEIEFVVEIPSYNFHIVTHDQYRSREEILYLLRLFDYRTPLEEIYANYSKKF